MASLEESIKAAEQWSKVDPSLTTAQYVQNLLQRCMDDDDSQAKDELVSLFPSDNRRISFGTAGLRAAMKPGPLGMNDLVIVQTAQGIAKYCFDQQKDVQQKKKLKAIIGYDHRKNPELNISSLSFAILTALVFEEAGIESILLDGYAFTPLVPFGLQYSEAVVGIMVTASHNPKQDDGYKVYASDGCQIRSPMDSEISNFILQNLEPWKDYRQILKTRMENFQNDDPCLGLSDPKMTKDMLEAYFTALKDHGLMTGQAKLPQEPNSLTPPLFAYTAMHGVGHPFAKRVFQEFDLPPFKSIPTQKDPDFSFPTVPFPNPEEKGALDIAKEFAAENDCDIVIANDPDADRLAIAEKDRPTGEWTVFTGDQLGSMLGYWIWYQIGKDCGKVSIVL